jgi:hypothetical protein
MNPSKLVSQSNRSFATVLLAVSLPGFLRPHHTNSLFDPVEDWLYWLISAAALVSLLLGIVYLSDLTTPRTQSIGFKQSGQVELALSGGGDPDSTGKGLTIQPSRSTLPQNISQPPE